MAVFPEIQLPKTKAIIVEARQSSLFRKIENGCLQEVLIEQLSEIRLVPLGRMRLRRIMRPSR